MLAAVTAPQHLLDNEYALKQYGTTCATSAHRELERHAVPFCLGTYIIRLTYTLGDIQELRPLKKKIKKDIMMTPKQNISTSNHH